VSGVIVEQHAAEGTQALSTPQVVRYSRTLGSGRDDRLGRGMELDYLAAAARVAWPAGVTLAATIGWRVS
jgi:hypothetical protein